MGVPSEWEYCMGIHEPLLFVICSTNSGQYYCAMPLKNFFCLFQLCEVQIFREFEAYEQVPPSQHYSEVNLYFILTAYYSNVLVIDLSGFQLRVATGIILNFTVPHLSGICVFPCRQPCDPSPCLVSLFYLVSTGNIYLQCLTTVNCITLC